MEEQENLHPSDNSQSFREAESANRWILHPKAPHVQGGTTSPKQNTLKKHFNHPHPLTQIPQADL